MTRLRKVIYGVGLLALGSCGGGEGPVGPDEDPGAISVTFGSSITTIGAIQFVVPTPSGGAIQSFAQSAGYAVYTRSLGNGSVRVIITGTFTPGAVATFSVPDRDVIASYTPQREAAADKNTYALYTGNDYTLTLAKVGVSR